jgi:hypothetical protein
MEHAIGKSISQDSWLKLAQKRTYAMDLFITMEVLYH